MNRIMIIDSSGSGKSILARKLGKKLVKFYIVSQKIFLNY